MKVKFLQAGNGDSIWISFPDENNITRNILIDGGIGRTYQYKDKKKKTVIGDLQKTLQEIRAIGENSKIDLLILTHVDDDHIGGLLKWFSKDKTFNNLVGKIWFNSSRLITNAFDHEEIPENNLQLDIKNDLFTSYKQGKDFEELAQTMGLLHGSLIMTGQMHPFYNSELRILSPGREKLEKLLHKWEIEEESRYTAKSNDYGRTIAEHMVADSYQEDDAVHNGSSIAFIFTYGGKNYLFLADAHPGEIVKGLNHFGYNSETKLAAEFVKLSHHGSKGNTSNELLNLINSNYFIISSDGNIHSLPHKQCLARIIKQKHNVTLLFNYPELIDKIFQENDCQQYTFNVKSVTESGLDVIV